MHAARLNQIKTDPQDRVNFSMMGDSPISFFILTNAGLKVISLVFSPISKTNDHLIGGFLSAVQSFTSTVFAEDLGQIRLEEITLLIKIKPPLTFVYVFKGSAECAQEKLIDIIDCLAQDDELWTALMFVNQTGMSIPNEIENIIESIISLIVER